MEREIIIRTGSMEEAAALSRLLPEFTDPAGEEEYRRRLTGVPHLILVAELEGVSIGFKAGYERDGGFYSWMGGVLPEYRRMGVAAALAERQEKWARAQGYSAITFKTRNQHKRMLIFALGNGFDIVGFSPKPDLSANRILLQKRL